MQVLATFISARISAFKAREVTREIQGLPVQAALDILRFTPKKAAAMIDKTLRSAIANAENNNNLRVERLVVQEAVVGEGPTFRRFTPKARGSAGPIRKRTSHIRIVLTDEVEIPVKEARPRKSAAKGKLTSRARRAAGESVKKGSAKVQAQPVEDIVESTAEETPEVGDATVETESAAEATSVESKESKE